MKADNIHSNIKISDLSYELQKAVVTEYFNFKKSDDLRQYLLQLPFEGDREYLHYIMKSLTGSLRKS